MPFQIDSPVDSHFYSHCKSLKDLIRAFISQSTVNAKGKFKMRKMRLLASFKGWSRDCYAWSAVAGETIETRVCEEPRF